MREITGNIWDYWMKPQTVVCITTNGALTVSGNAVMGRGVAHQATFRVHHLQKKVGRLIRANGNIVQMVEAEPLLLFPVKYRWIERADLDLIRKSVSELAAIATNAPTFTFILPRPGCGNGRRRWSEVRGLLQELPDNVSVIHFGNEDDD